MYKRRGLFKIEVSELKTIEEMPFFDTIGVDNKVIAQAKCLF